MEKLAQQIAGGGQRGFIDDKKIKDLDTFNGDEDKWRERSMKLVAAVKEGDPDIHAFIIWAALEEEEISEFDIHDAAPEHDGARSATDLQTNSFTSSVVRRGVFTTAYRKKMDTNFGGF